MRVAQELIVLPLAVQVLLTIVVLVILGMRRAAYLRTSGISVLDQKLPQDRVYDRKTQQAVNNFRNQFEIPVLFYVVSLLALILRQIDVLFLGLAGLFVVSRMAHAIVHVTNNIVIVRFLFWSLALFAVVIMWALLVARIVLAEI